MFDRGDDILTLEEVKRNVYKQATKILRDMIGAYEQGILDNPATAATYCALLACICEGKVEGDFDEDDKNKVKWSLTEKYEKILKEIEASAMAEAIATGKVVKGPWKQ